MDRDAFPSWPFRGMHLLSYTDDTYPVCLPTHSRHPFITQQLFQTLVELQKPLPEKDHLHTRDAYVRGLCTIGTATICVGIILWCANGPRTTCQ